MMAVVLLATVVASTGSAYLGGLRAQREQEEGLRRVARTLAEASFPLTQRVLTQMTGLSGAEFVLVGDDGQSHESTLPVESDGLDALGAIRLVPPVPAGSSKPSVILGGREFFVDWVAVSGRSPPATPGTLYVLYPKDRWSARLRQATYPALLTGILAAGLALATTTLLGRRFVRPIHELVAQTAGIAGGMFTPVAVARRNDELRDLALSINQMTEKLARYEGDVRRNERLRTLGQVGAAMAHQLRNAATGGRMAIEFHRGDCPLGATDESLGMALGQLRLMESYLQRFLAIGKQGPALLERASMDDIVQEVLTLLAPASSHAGVDVRFVRSEAPLCLRGECEGLRQLVTNLVANAIEAAGAQRGEPARVEVALRRVGAGRGLLEVSDSGPGPDPSVQDRLFEAFVSAKPEGVGLGLWVARQVAEAHGGSLRWERRQGVTCFSFDFPLEGDDDHGASVDCG
jgi:signal transduction histidine kinase